jgi:type I restriction enzyme S subunit
VGIIDQLESNEADLRKSIEQTKKKVLDLAIHGKLVPQDPDDEPASELLKRIVETHGRASNNGRASKISKGKKSAISSDNLDDVPFEVPEGWVWCRLGDISVDSADGPFGSNLKKEHYTDKQEVRIVQLSNIGELNWRDDNVKYTTFEHLKVISRSEVFPGDIIIAKMMPAGRAIICPSKERKYVLSSDAVKFSFSNLVYNKYLFYSINSSVFKEQVYDNVQGVTRVRTSLVKLREYFIPLPPLSEQCRIVAKIEEVFGELDRMLEMIG